MNKCYKPEPVVGLMDFVRAAKGDFLLVDVRVAKF